MMSHKTVSLAFRSRNVVLVLSCYCRHLESFCPFKDIFGCRNVLSVFIILFVASLMVAAIAECSVSDATVEVRCPSAVPEMAAGVRLTSCHL